MLQMGFDVSKVTRAAQPKSARALRQRPFHARPHCIARLKLRGLLALASLLQDFVLGLRAQLQRPRSLGGLRALGARRTGLARGGRKAHVDHGIPKGSVALRPTLTHLALGTAHAVVGPINGQVSESKPLPSAGWPPGIQSDRPYDLNAL